MGFFGERRGFKELVLDAWGDSEDNHGPSPKEVGGNLGADFPHGHPKTCCPTLVGALLPLRALSLLSEHFPEKSQIFYYVQALPHSSLPKGPLVPLRHFFPY